MNRLYLSNRSKRTNLCVFSLALVCSSGDATSRVHEFMLLGFAEGIEADQQLLVIIGGGEEPAAAA